MSLLPAASREGDTRGHLGGVPATGDEASLGVAISASREVWQRAQPRPVTGE